MRIRVLSDLHREFGHTALSEVAADLVILAGDIDRGVRGVTWARKRFPGVPVLYVAGNHEYYGERLGRLLEKMREAAAGSSVTILENETVTYGGYRFFGATLWTGFELFGDRSAAMLAASARQGGMTDYRKIRRRDASRLRPLHTACLHADSRVALAAFLQAGDRARSIVITHHAPSPRSILPEKKTDVLSAAYASDLDSLIEQHGPALWVHGHIHAVRDYTIGATRILSNPLGYQTRDNPERTGFQPELVVEI